MHFINTSLIVFIFGNRTGRIYIIRSPHLLSTQHYTHYAQDWNQLYSQTQEGTGGNSARSQESIEHKQQ